MFTHGRSNNITIFWFFLKLLDNNMCNTASVLFLRQTPAVDALSTGRFIIS